MRDFCRSLAVWKEFDTYKSRCSISKKTKLFRDTLFNLDVFSETDSIELDTPLFKVIGPGMDKGSYQVKVRGGLIKTTHNDKSIWMVMEPSIITIRLTSGIPAVYNNWCKQFGSRGNQHASGTYCMGNIHYDNYKHLDERLKLLSMLAQIVYSNNPNDSTWSSMKTIYIDTLPKSLEKYVVNSVHSRPPDDIRHVELDSGAVDMYMKLPTNDNVSWDNSRGRIQTTLTNLNEFTYKYTFVGEYEYKSPRSTNTIKLKDFTINLRGAIW